MVQSANGMHLDTVGERSQRAVDRLESEAPDVDLSGVRIYVVGAGATSVVGMTAGEIRGIGSFWRSWFASHGATVVLYGANLARYPIEEG